MTQEIAAEDFEIFEVPASTPNFRTELAEKLADLVPEAVADGKIDVTKLQELLSDDVADASERFGLFWPGKKRALRAAQEPTTATLRPDFENSKDWDTTKNVFIEGDNLEVLKILQKHYHGKIKMIYIDPPYNTGNDFIYPDNYTEGLDSYLDWTRQVNDEGKKLSTNSETGGRFHSNWLNMMYPRLKLARNLLTDDGAIFISIDDTEAPNLLEICREIFGEANVLGALIHQRAKGGGQAKFIVRGHDYLIAICRNIARFAPLIRPKVVQQPVISIGGVDYLKNDDVVRRSFGKYDRALDRRCFYEELEQVKGRDKKLEIDQKIETGQLHLEWREDVGMHVIYELIPVDSATSKIYSIIRVLSEEGKNDLTALGLDGYFDYPKPTDLIVQLIQAVALFDKQAVVLDFFAGSGSTAHAVFKLNAQDQGSRSFIAVQLPEPVDPDSVAGRAGLTNLAEISRIRIQTAGEILSGTRDLIDEVEVGSADFGFRAFKLTQSNFAAWSISSQANSTTLEQHLIELRESANDDASQDAILTEILLKQGYSLTEKIAPIEISGLRFLSVNDGVVLSYLDEHEKPSLGQLREVIESRPARFIILEDAFHGDDELKTNLAQLCASKSVELWTA